MNVYAVTGVYHGSIIECDNESEAKYIFHQLYTDEEIICIKDITQSNLENL